MRNTLKKLGLFIILFFVFILKELFYIIPLDILNIRYDSLNYNMQTLLSIISSLIFSIILIIIYRKYLKECIKDYKNNFFNNLNLGMKCWFVGLTIMCFSNLLIAKFSPVHEANNEIIVQQMLKQAPFLSFISATFLAPFTEEMLFRKSFGDIFKNKKIMFIASGLVFGLLHVIFTLKTPWDLLYVIPYGALGSSFSYILYKKDNVLIPITFHMIHNGALTLLSIILTVIAK